MTGGGVDDDANGSERTRHGFGFYRHLVTMGGGRLGAAERTTETVDAVITSGQVLCSLT